jgi:hypothetical protein
MTITGLAIPVITLLPGCYLFSEYGADESIPGYKAMARIIYSRSEKGEKVYMNAFMFLSRTPVK